MKYSYKLAFLHIISSVSFLFQLFYGSVTDWIITLFVYAFVAISLTMTFHRHLAHKSFVFKNELIRKFFITVCTIGSGFSSPITWVAIHREHHKFSDTDNDPHPGSKLTNLLKLHFTSWNIQPKIKYAVDLAKDPYCKFMHNYYFVLHGIYALLLLLIDPWLIIIFYLTPICLLWHGGNAVNSLSHLYGYRNFDTSDKSKNNWFIALIFFGEWHNNHHKFPGSARHGYNYYEVDITYYVIKFLGKDIKLHH
jgi:fatty-acid desaturase